MTEARSCGMYVGMCKGTTSERELRNTGICVGILSDRTSVLRRDYVGIVSGLCRMSGVMSDYTGVMSGPRASQGDMMCLRKGHLDPA